MLESFMTDIYEKALALDLLKKVSFYANIRHSYNCFYYWNEASTYLNYILDDLGNVNPTKKEELYGNIVSVRDSFGDVRKFSGMIDMCIVPKLMDYLGGFTGINVTEGSWTLESALTGFLTIKKDGKYLHSQFDPMWESFLFAYDIYKPEIRRYNILGGGLGYLAYQLWRLSDKEAEIYVYEIDETVKTYADLYGVASLIDNGNIHYVCDKNRDKVIEECFGSVVENEVIPVIYFWDDEGYDGVYAEQILQSRSNLQTERYFEHSWKRNYSRNILFEHSDISTFDSTKLHDEWVIVAAGPSLNDNGDFIKESVGNRTICTVNTSLKWFRNNGIHPDMCMACDPQKEMLRNIEGVEDFSEGIPLIADYVTYSKYVEKYKGPRFFVYTPCSCKLASDDIDESDIWKFGGTVTSMALEAAYRMGAKKIYLIGADLGFPGGKTYADSVSKDIEKWDKNEVSVVSVDDKTIPTSRPFFEYKLQIENQILYHPDVEVINRSLHGAYINGTYSSKWWERLPNKEHSGNLSGFFEELKKDSLILGWREKYYIFQQAVYVLELCSIIHDDAEKKVIESAYKVIYDAFVNELAPNSPVNAVTDEELTYIFTNEFWNTDDVQTRKVLDIARAETQNRKKVLIINTSEKLGGNRVPIHDAVPVRYNDDLKNAVNVNFENRSFPYFQFSAGMPDIEHYRVFLESMANKKPGKLIIASRYGLLSDCCSSVLNIPTNYK